MNTVAIVGASGFIGRHLVADLIRFGKGRIKVLSRYGQQAFGAMGGGMEVVKGDLQDPVSLQGFLEADCTVINLVYLWGRGEQENLAVTRNLLDACKAAHVGRIIHCSTAAVSGRVQESLVTESTSCRPITEYGITKLKVERVVLDTAHGHFDACILRPTSVFGPEGEPLKKLAGDLTAGSRWRSYLKSCLFGRRRMNLVHVSNVVAAILFLVDRKENLNGEVFIVSDDDSPFNNFADVEQFLMREFSAPVYGLPRLIAPPILLAFFLRCLGRNNINPSCNYDPSKLIDMGFKRPVSFETGLAEYAKWYRSTYLHGRRGGIA